MEAGNRSSLASGVLSRRGFLGGSAAVAAASLLAGCESGNGGGGGGRGGGPYPSHPDYRFVFVNHVTTNEFFVATRYGIADACALVGCQYQWVGSKNSDVGEMVDRMHAAISDKADGIAVPLVEATAFNEPTQRALDAGIPVIAYNADAPSSSGNPRLAYIGQDLYLSGRDLGQRIVQEVDSGLVAGFIATPGQLNIQPRFDGAKAEIQASGKPIQFEQITTGAEIPAELSAIEAWYLGHKDVKGMYAVDAGSTQGVAEIMQKYSLASQGVKSGGYDLLTKTVSNIQQGHMGFTIDQQAYLQGFLPVLQLFLHKISGALTGPAHVDTGVKFVTKNNLKPWATTKTRYQGSSSEQKVVSASS
ncbi:MAG: sugar ABC transporter substrate-binding protein [bacterium]|jgi:simple sugar transport system substrate-binding protein|nr:sugar ABC transporter substrate-binding protein [bacterium]